MRTGNRTALREHRPPGLGRAPENSPGRIPSHPGRLDSGSRTRRGREEAPVCWGHAMCASPGKRRHARRGHRDVRRIERRRGGERGGGGGGLPAERGDFNNRPFTRCLRPPRRDIVPKRVFESTFACDRALVSPLGSANKTSAAHREEAGVPGGGVGKGALGSDCPG